MILTLIKPKYYWNKLVKLLIVFKSYQNIYYRKGSMEEFTYGKPTTTETGMSNDKFLLCSLPPMRVFNKINQILGAQLYKNKCRF